MHLILEKSSLSEYENETKFTNTLSELLLYFSSTPSELVILNYTTFSSLGVLIKLDTKIILKIEKREIKGN